MRGEFIPIWSETWRNIWRPLTWEGSVPSDVYCDLYRELSNAFAEVPSIEDLAVIIGDPVKSFQAFRDSRCIQFSNEKALVRFFEATYDVLDEFQDAALADRYFELLAGFIERYSLGYSLRRPCLLSPTLPGIFSDVSCGLKKLSETDAHIAELYQAHEEAVKDLRFGATEERIKTCIGKQFMLLEAVASTSDLVNASTLGSICDQVQSWPHVTVKESLRKLYGFASDYPGIRHGGNPAAKLRGMDARDMTAISIVLTGYTVYLTSSLHTKLTSFISDRDDRQKP